MLYSDEQILQLNNKTKKYVTISSILLGLSIAIFVTLLFFLNDSTIKVIQALTIIVISLAVCFFLYVVINIVLPNKRRIKLIKNILSGEENTYQCEVVDVSRLRTINHNIKVYDVSILVDGKMMTVLLDSEFEGLMCKGQVTLKVRNKYIVEIIK